MSGNCAVHADKNMKVSELVVVARAWLGWGSTTCDIERVFSQHQAIFGASRRGRMTRQREQDIVTLCADWHEHDQDAVVKAAVDMWQSKCFGVRPKYKRRKDVGVSRRRTQASDEKPTMSEFAAARRKEVGLLTQNASSPIVSKRKLKELTADAWTPSMQAEENHMGRKHTTRLMEVAAAGGDPAPALLKGGPAATIYHKSRDPPSRIPVLDAETA